MLVTILLHQCGLSVIGEQLHLEKEPSNPHDNIIVVIMKAIMIQQYFRFTGNINTTILILIHKVTSYTQTDIHLTNIPQPD